MEQLVLGSVVLSVLHAIIPNHWLPLVAISKSEGWTFRETILASTLTAFAHTFSTILLGIFIGWAGLEFLHHYEEFGIFLASGILMGFGFYYLLLHFNNRRHSHNFNHRPFENRSKIAIVLSLSLMMFLSPCLEMESFYFSAGQHGWKGIFLISAVYLLLTVSLIVLLVALSVRGIKVSGSGWLQRQERLITGLLLVGLGIFNLFFH